MSCIIFCSPVAGMMELVDVTDSKSVDGNIVWVRVPLPAPCGDDDFDTRVSRLSSLLFCLKTAENRGLYNTFMKSAAAGWSNSKSVAALFVFGGNRCFIGESLCYCVVSAIWRGFVKRSGISLYYGYANKTRRFLAKRIGGFHIVFIRSSKRLFWRSVSELHLAKSVRCSSVSCAGSTSSAKNCAKLMPNALHTASRVGSVGALFLLNIFVTVEWERFASFARR